MSEPAFSEAKLDVLKELGNIGAGSATTALSAMLGDARITMVVPEVKVVGLNEVPELAGDPESPVTASHISISGDTSGHMIFLMSDESALQMSNLLTGRDLDGLDELGWSAMAELGNIVITSYLNAMSEITGLAMTPSVPALAADMAGAIVSTVLANNGDTGEYVLAINTSFKVADVEVQGFVVFLPGKDQMDEIFRSVGMEDA